MRAILRETPNGLTVFFSFFLLAGVLIAVFMGEKIINDAQANPYQGVAIMQANQSL